MLLNLILARSPHNQPPSPETFLRFVVDENLSSADVFRVNAFWRPQHLHCPFCAFDYDVYGRLEDLAEDTAAVLIRSGNKEFFRGFGREIKVNDSGGQKKKEKGGDWFWQSVPESLRQEVQAVFQEDFDLFGYA